MKRPILRLIGYNLLGSLLLGVSVTAFAVHADFAPGGVSGLAVMANHLFRFPIGLTTLLINVPIVLCTFRKLGLRFFVHSALTMMLGAFVVDVVMAGMPDPGLPRLVSSLLSGVCAGAGYGLIFDIGSSTGGTDFIIVALRRWKPRLTFGLLAFLIDGSIISLSVPVFRDWMSFLCGMAYTLLASLTMDAVVWVLERMRGRRARAGNESAG